MQYVKLTVDIRGKQAYETDVLTYYLAEAGFESFETVMDHRQTEPAELCAYIPVTAFDEKGLTQILENYSYGVETLPDKDWNEEWEKNFFQPIVIGNRCVVHSSFHTGVPKADYDIVINPQMAFGTGHHATTANMISWLLDEPVEGCRVLDMGCGTSILGILAAMRGAASVDGIDVDEWCIRNSAENIALNKVCMRVELGNADSLSGRGYDLILANINRNILLQDMPAYAACLPYGGRLFLSGFYRTDLPVIEAKAAELGLRLEGVKSFGSDNPQSCAQSDGEWVAAKFVK